MAVARSIPSRVDSELSEAPLSSTAGTRALIQSLEAAACEGERCPLSTEVLEGLRSLMAGQLRLEEMLRKLVEEPAAAEASSKPRPCQQQVSIAADTGTIEEEPFEGRTSPSRRFLTASRTSSVSQTQPAWFQNLQMRQEIQGSEGQLAVELSKHRVNNEGVASLSSGALTLSSPSRRSTLDGFDKVCCTALSPTSGVRLCFDLLSLIVLSYDLASVPYVLAFESEDIMLTWLTYASMAYWGLDILLNFRTGFYSNGEFEMGACNIARHYLRGSFTIDFCALAVDVFDVFLLKRMSVSSSESTSFKLVRIFKVSRLLRLMGIFRLRKLRQLLELVTAHHASAAKRITVFFVELSAFIAMFLWLNHFVACLWVFLAINGREHSDTGVTWLHLTTDDRVYSSYGDAYQYTTALHWAVTQMTPGSMQVFPQNTAERIYNIVCLVAGLVVFSSIISQISARITNFRIQTQNIRSQMEALATFLERAGVGVDVRLAVVKQANIRLHETRPVSLPNLGVINKLPLSLRSKLQLELCDPHLQDHPYLAFVKEADEFAWKEICSTCVGFSMLMRTDTLFIDGSKAVAMYVVTMGNISYFPATSFSHSHSTQVTELKDPVVVVTGGRLSEAALWCEWRHLGTAEVVDARACEVLTLQTEPLLTILLRDPLMAQVTWAYGQSFITSLKASLPPVDDLPDDVSLPCGPDEVFASMPTDAVICCGEVALNLVQKQRLTLIGMIHSASSERTEELVREVEAGRAALLVTKKGVTRCIPQLLLRLSRSDGRVLVRLRLAKRPDGSMEASCKLPGAKLNACEHATDCFHRMMQGKLRPLAAGVEVDGLEKHNETKTSNRLGIPTRYISTIVSAEWSEDADAGLREFLVREGKRQMPRAGSKDFHPTGLLSGTLRGWFSDAPDDYVDADVYSFPSGAVYAWLTLAEHEYFDSQRGQRSLIQWLLFLDMWENTENPDNTWDRQISD